MMDRSLAECRLYVCSNASPYTLVIRGHTEWSQDMPGWGMRGSVRNMLQPHDKMLCVYRQGERLHVKQILASMGGWYTAPKGRQGCAVNLAELNTWPVCPSARTEEVLRIPHAVCQDDWRGKRQWQDEIPLPEIHVTRCKKTLCGTLSYVYILLPPTLDIAKIIQKFGRTMLQISSRIGSLVCYEMFSLFYNFLSTAAVTVCPDDAARFVCDKAAMLQER